MKLICHIFAHLKASLPLPTHVRKADILDLSDEVGDWVNGFDPIHDFHKMLDRCRVRIYVI